MQIKNNKIVPAQDYLALKSQIKVDDKVKSGDYFTIKNATNKYKYYRSGRCKNIGDIKDPNNSKYCDCKT
ncbi:Ig-like domain-containing protein [Staphylococcus aureus]